MLFSDAPGREELHGPAQPEWDIQRDAGLVPEAPITPSSQDDKPCRAAPHRAGSTCQPGPGGRMAERDAGAGAAGTQALSLLLWRWELKMQKAAHPAAGAGTGSTRPAVLRSPGATAPAPDGCPVCGTMCGHRDDPWGG